MGWYYRRILPFSSGWTLIKLLLWTFVYETNIDFFYSRSFQHLFRRFDVTLHSPLKIRQARQKIEDFSDVTFTSSLKHYCRIEHFNKHFCVVVKLQHIQTITLHTRTFDSESFGYWNTRLTLAWFRSSLVVSLCTQEPPPLQLSSGAAEQFHFFWLTRTLTRSFITMSENNLPVRHVLKFHRLRVFSLRLEQWYSCFSSLYVYLPWH